MTWLARLGKDGMFVWAWGINGCFSVVGAALVPIVATAFGLSAVLDVSAVAYLLAIPALIAVLLPRRARQRPGAGMITRRDSLRIAASGLALAMTATPLRTAAPLAEGKGDLVAFAQFALPL